MGVSHNQGCLLGDPHYKGYSILVSILGSLCFGKYHITVT